ncbi:hypothetical protein [Fuerstiella marisgermanici]|uniref:site-specific DNA-methyltransferase (cytosine-N(4)-specific) n=1 Tax=Fuerstiella marisgermanici TaxID=1891926 RepID=A0A1P8WF03_9PLAN|nr:hypothetical protein [Fuerstiella marisgermanici]APZ92644.1 DNA methylase [Fuerstiella marisgermanici]
MKSIREILGRQTIHPFPARMAPDLALNAIGDTDSCLNILDPMSGSGTVLAVARANGHRAIGIDCDPLSVLLAKTWTTSIDPETVATKASIVLDRARKLFRECKSGQAYPTVDDETRKFLRFWFDDYARKQLHCLAKCIGRVQNQDVRDVLWAGFSRLIIVKKNGASRAMDMSHSRPHRAFEVAPLKPFTGFLGAVNRVAENCPTQHSKGSGPRADLRLGDAKNIPLKKETIDLVVTSPPYLNMIDYMRCSKFSLVWMGYTISSLRDIRSDSIGTDRISKSEPPCEMVERAMSEMCNLKNVSDRNKLMLTRYVTDMKSAILEVARVLKPMGRAVYVIGNSNLKGEFVENSTAARSLAENTKLRLITEQIRELPPNRRYLPPPSSTKSGENLQGRMRTEVVLSFQKAG